MAALVVDAEERVSVISEMYNALCILDQLSSMPGYIKVADKYRVPVAEAVTCVMLAICMISGAPAEEIHNTVKAINSEAGKTAH